MGNIMLGSLINYLRNGLTQSREERIVDAEKRVLANFEDVGISIAPACTFACSQEVLQGMERLERNDKEDTWSGSPLQQRSDVTVAAPFQNNNVAILTNNS